MSPSITPAGDAGSGEGESELGGCRGGRGAAGRLAGRGPGARRGAGGAGRRRQGGLQGAAASRPGAPSKSPSRSGAGEGGAKSGRRLCRRSRGAATLAPRPPALTRTHTRAQEAGGPGPTGPPWTPPARGAETPRRCPALSSAPRRGKGEGARGVLICKYLTIDYAKPQGSLASSPAGWGRPGGTRRQP